MKILVLGANSTIAKELQKIWAAKGYSLVLVGRNTDVLDKLANDLKVRGAQTVATVQKDLTEISDADAFVRNLWSKHNGFDRVFMAQGALGNQRDDEKSWHDTSKIIAVNFSSHIAFLTPLANLMSDAGKGTLAVITSVAGDRGKQSNYIYCSAKAGKIAFLSGLRGRLLKRNVHVVDLRLGFVDTEMTKEFKKGPLWAKPKAVANLIDKAIEKKSDVSYIPNFWYIIMLIIRAIPEGIFKKLNL